MIRTRDMQAGPSASTFDGVLAIVRRETLVLAVALQTRDDDAAMIAEARLRWSLAAAYHFVVPSYIGLLETHGRLWRTSRRRSLAAA